MALDERLHRELERTARPADPTGVYEGLIRRHERRKIVRRVQAGGLALVVLLGTIGGFYTLTRVFGGSSEIATPATDTNGRLALALYSEPRTQRIALINPDGTGIHFLTSGDAIDSTPAWSPDGTLLVFWRAGPAVRQGLWVMGADGSDAHLLLETDVSIRAIEWSPDGSRIAFIQIQIPTGPATELDFSDDLYVMDADGTDVTPLITDGQVEDFDWSPDGTQLVIDRQFAIGQNLLGYDLAVVEVNGGAERPLTSNGSSRDPTWSPDGSTIVYVSSDSADFFDTDLFAIAPNGTGRVRLTDDPATEEHPVFSPDGSLVAFTRLPNGDGSACELVSIKSDGSDINVIGTKDTLGGCPLSIAWQSISQGEQVSPVPSPSEPPTESPTPEVGEDIGLGFPVCDVMSVSGRFGPDGVGTALVATRMGDAGRCPPLDGAFQVVAVDVSGDGMPDASYGPLECDGFCTVFAAPDVDGDGTDELLIQNIQFSIAGLRLYEVRADPAEVFPVTVSTPGYPERGLPAGAQPQLWLGGDGFNFDELSCATMLGARVLIQTSASTNPPDQPDPVWRAAETVFSLNPDGTIAVVSSRTYEEPAGSEPPSFDVPGPGLCGARLPYPFRDL